MHTTESAPKSACVEPPGGETCIAAARAPYIVCASEGMHVSTCTLRLLLCEEALADLQV